MIRTNHIINEATVNNDNTNGGMDMKNNSISKEEFAVMVKNAVEESLGAGYEVTVSNTVKNNSTCRTGLVIKKDGGCIAPVIYLEELFRSYQEGYADMYDICKKVITLYEENKLPSGFDVTGITDFEHCKDRICFKLVNAERNSGLLASAPHRIVCGDLAVIYYVLVKHDRDGMASVILRNDLYSMWEKTEEEIFGVAMHNTQRMLRGSVQSIQSVLMDIIGRMDGCNSEFYDMAVSEDIIPMYVCTNADKVNGAATMLYEGLLKEFSEKTGDDFYILPSSINEVLLVPMSAGTDPECLKAMVHAVNCQEVPAEEVLSDSVYVYRRITDSIEMV